MLQDDGWCCYTIHQNLEMKQAGICLIGLWLMLRAGAQDTVHQLDSFFTALYQDATLNGNVLVTENDRPVYRRSFGYAQVQDSLPNTEETRFHLASVSKIFTATAILQLKDKGRLRLDDPVVQYLPGFPFAGITIRHLLSHTSGLPDFQVFEVPHSEDTGRIFTNADLVPAIKRYNRPMPAPGEKWSYSNTGYALLALVVEKLSGLSFPDYARQYIFRPAGMLHTYIQTSLLQVTDRERAIPYDYFIYAPYRLKAVADIPRYRIPSVILGAIIGPGNVVSTTGDLWRFDQALYKGRLLQPATLEEAFTPAKLNNGQPAAMGWGNGQSYYGLGWMILRDTAMGKVVWHSGGAAGMVTVFLRNITRHQTVTVLDNVTHRNIHGDGVNALYLLNHLPVATGKKSLAALYVQALFKQGADFATVRYNELKADTAQYYMDERELNTYGLELLWNGQPQLALEALQLNTLLYPASWNVYDSYAEALWQNGKKEEAIAMYRKSIQMNPDNKGGKEALQKILGTH
jgi:CubicO group peptidase (beta-lactamase class C family)